MLQARNGDRRKNRLKGKLFTDQSASMRGSFPVSKNKLLFHRHPGATRPARSIGGHSSIDHSGLRQSGGRVLRMSLYMRSACS